MPTIKPAQSPLDSGQTLKGAYDDSNSAFRVETLNAMIPTAYDYVSVAYPDAVTEVYTFKTGGSGGTVVSTVTVVYTDASKNFLSSATRT